MTAWLIEWPADDRLPVRYWHPRLGFTVDPYKAIWFCRREDAEAMARTDRLVHYGVVEAEHVFGLQLSGEAQ